MITQIPMQYNAFGYQFLSPIYKNRKWKGWHPGVDFNFRQKGSSNPAYSDLGLPIGAWADGEVAYSSDLGYGWGNMVVIWHQELGYFSRGAHFKTVNVKVNQKVKRGDLIGTCGKSGTKFPHYHFDLPRNRMEDWSKYIYGKSKSQVRREYLDPMVELENLEKQKPSKWASTWWEALKSIGVNLGDPKGKCDLKKVFEELEKAGHIKNGLMTNERLAVVLLERIPKILKSLQ